MKGVIFTLTVTMCIVIFSYYTDTVLDSTSASMVDSVEEIDAAIQNYDYEKAEKKLKSFEKKWEKNEFIWSILIDHSEIDNIKESIAHIKAYLKTEDFSELNAEISGLYLYLNHIPDNEHLTIENIF